MRIRNLFLTVVILATTVIAVPAIACDGCKGHSSPPAQNESESAFQGLVEDYLFIQTALAGDTTKGIAERATSIEKTSLKLTKSFDPAVAGVDGENSGELKKILPVLSQAAAELAKAKKLDAIRASFGNLSDSMIAYRKLASGEKPVVAYCPMAKKSWLQDGKNINNPYYGSSMLRCGTIVASND